MKINKCYLVMPLLAMALVSCGGRNNEYTADEYYVKDCPTRYDNTKGFNIIQLTDTHIGNMCDRKLQYKFMQKTIDKSNRYLKTKLSDENAKADLIVVTGDLFTFGTREIAKEYFAFLDKQEIPWTVCFGNHDEQAYYSIDWLTGYLNKLNTKRIESTNKNKLESYCVFKDIQDDNVFGNSNFVIPIKNDEGKTVENLYFLDSNRYNFQYNGYDAIHEDQVKWFGNMVDHSVENEGEIPQGLAFFHIPLIEFNNAVSPKGELKEGYEWVKDEDDKHDLTTTGEHSASPKINTGLYKMMKDKGNIRGVFVGHDHVNGWAAKNKVDNITFSFGVKSTDTVDHDNESMGGQLIMLNKTHGQAGSDFDKNNFTIHQITHKYKDLDKEEN